MITTIALKSIIIMIMMIMIIMIITIIVIIIIIIESGPGDGAQVVNVAAIDEDADEEAQEDLSLIYNIYYDNNNYY